MKLGQTILMLRTRRGLSQEKLAEAVGVSRQAVSKWEVGDSVPDTDKLIPLARTLGVTVDELLGNVPEDGEEEADKVPDAPSQCATPPAKQPGWFATHWYWLGLIPVAWGVWQLLWLLVAVFGLVGFTGITETGVVGYTYIG